MPAPRRNPLPTTPNPVKTPCDPPPTSIAATRGPIYSQIFVDADIGMTGMSRRIVVNDLSWS